MMNHDTLLMLCVLFAIIGIIALVVRNDTISTRQRLTQATFVGISAGGLIGMDGRYVLGIVVSIVSLAFYAVLYYRYMQVRRHYVEKDRAVPLYKRM